MTFVFFVYWLPFLVLLLKPLRSSCRLLLLFFALTLFISTLVRLLCLMMVMRLAAAATNATASLLATEACVVTATALVL